MKERKKEADRRSIKSSSSTALIKFISSLLVVILYATSFKIFKIDKNSFETTISYFMLVFLLAAGVLLAQSIWQLVVSKKSKTVVSQHSLSLSNYFYLYTGVVIGVIFLNGYQYVSDGSFSRLGTITFVTVFISFIVSNLLSFQYHKGETKRSRNN